MKLFGYILIALGICITSTAIGYLFGEPYGWLTLGLGFVALGIYSVQGKAFN